jgi:hypothetical protein
VLTIEDTLSPDNLDQAMYDVPPISDYKISVWSADEDCSSAAQSSSDDCEADFADFSTWFAGQQLSVQELHQGKLNAADGVCLDTEWTWRTVESLSPHSKSEHLSMAKKPVYALQFWVPVPLFLFNRCEYRVLRAKASITFADNREVDLHPLTEYSAPINIPVEVLTKDKHMRCNAL